MPLPPTPPGTEALGPFSEPLPRQANPSLTPKQHEANREPTRHEPSNFRKITHLPFRNRSPWITANQARNPPPSFKTAIQPLRPPQPSPATKALGLPPVHQASSSGYPPHPTGHPSKNAIFLLFVRVRNDKNTTHVAKFAPSLGPVPLPPTPPGTEALGHPPEPLPRQANPSETPKQHEANATATHHEVNPPTFEK